MAYSDCIFCRISGGEIPTDFVYEDDDIVIFKDINPLAPIHLLVVPKQHFTSSLEVDDPTLWGKLMGCAVDAARRLGIAENGFRMMINTGVDGGQTVPHLHLHLLAGQKFS